MIAPIQQNFVLNKLMKKNEMGNKHFIALNVQNMHIAFLRLWNIEKAQ